MTCKLLRIIAILILAIPANILHSQVPSYVPANGLVGWWPFNGNANDESGNGNNGTVNGATLTTDRFGSANSAYSFNGSSSFIECDTIGISNSAARSVSFWAKTSATSSMGLVSWGGNGLGDRFACDFNFSSQGITVDGANCAITYSAIVSNSNNQWHYYTFVMDDSSALNQVKVYQNGVLLNNILQNFNPTILLNTLSGTNLQFGRINIPSLNFHFYQGQLDDIGIWNRALTTAEITALYTNTPPPTVTVSATNTSICAGSPTTLTAASNGAGPCASSQLPSNLQTGLVGYWPFCGNASDVSGNGYNGVVNGATLTSDRYSNSSCAYNFTGSATSGNDIVASNSQNINTLSDYLTLSVWMNPSSLSNTYHPRIIERTEGTGGNVDRWFLTWTPLANNYKVEFTIEQANGSLTQVFSNYQIPINQWTLVNVVFSNGNVLVYINGQLDNTANITNTTLSHVSNVPIRFASTSANNSYFNGKLDDIGIWNRVLSASEIQQLYSLGQATYSWSPGGATTPSITVTPASTTTYTCTVTVNGQSAIANTVVNVNPLPVITASSATICPGDTVTLTASSGVTTSPCSTLSGSLASGLVGYWPFCGNANDISGNANHGTVNGATLTSDRFGNANNAYSFDGLDDYIQTNKWMNGINNNWTISFWVKMYAQSQTPTEKVFVLHRAHFQDKDLMWNNNSIYISDRNGAPSNITSSVFAPDQLWHHVIVKSSNNIIELYIDNNFISSVNRTVISDWDNSYYGSFFGGNGYDPSWHGTINGVLDDIGIWNRTLTIAEIQQVYNQGQTTLLWSPGGETTPTIIVSPNATTTYTCTSTNNGVSCSENQTIEVLQPTTSNLVETECNEFTLNGQTYTQSGIYTQVITNTAGCDSTITLDLTLNFPPTTPNIYVQNQTTLSTDDIPGLNYQWFFCTDLIDVPGATNAIFNPTANAYYAVVVSNACGSDTSACADVSTIGLYDFETQNVLLYPNPTNSLINVIVPTQLLGQDWELMDIRGRLVLSGQVEKETTIIQTSGLARGSYWLKIKTKHPIQVVKN